MLPESGQIPSLNGWRAIAIVLVMVSHVWAAYGDGPAPSYFAYLGRFGDLGVRIFLVLSGLLITRLLVIEHMRDKAIDFRAFYVRRALRILPVYFLYLAALACLQLAGLYADTLSSWVGAVTFTRNVVGYGKSAMGHLWSLSVEEQFYLLWPAMLPALLAARSRGRLGLVLAFIIVAIAISSRAVPCGEIAFICTRILGGKSLPHYADSLAIGCFAGFVTRSTFRVQKDQAGKAIGLSVAALALALYFEQVSTPLVASLAVTVQAISIAAAIVATAIADDTLLGRALNRPLADYIGRLSYSLYIWHLLFLAHYVGPELSWLPVYHPEVWWLAALLTAMASYHLYELPILRFKDALRASARTALS